MNFPSILQRLRIYTDQNEIYEELTEEHKTFNLKTELFMAALVIGVVNNRKSKKKPNKTNILDFIKLPPENQELIYLLYEVTSDTKDLQASVNNLLRYAEGGLELISGAYRDQGTLDLIRFIEETKEKWPQRIEEFKIAKQKTAIEKLIGERESSKIEYKSSMIWDYDAKKENKKLIGGIIAKVVLGLQNDLKVLNEHTLDQFEQHFTNILENYLKAENVLNASFRFEEVEGKMIAVVDVPKRAPKPVYYKKSEHEEDFYIRANNTSRRLPTSQISDYIKKQWSELNT